MTSNRQRNWHAMARHMSPEWTTERAFSSKSRIIDRHKRQLRNRKWRLLCAVLLPAAAIASWLVGSLFEVSDPNTPIAAVQSSGPVVPEASGVDLGDIEQQIKGTTVDLASNSLAPRVVPIKAGTKYSLEEGVDLSIYRIEEGSVRFETSEKTSGKLIVLVGDINIKDIGTTFVVEALEEDRAKVTVEEGVVVVTWPGGSQRLEENEEGAFPPIPVLPTLSVRSETRPTVVADEPRWQALAKEGDYRAAFTLIEKNRRRVRRRVDDLLLAADVMRQRGESKRAAEYLEQTLTLFPNDARASIAAFTLGRVYLYGLGRPAQAARAFSLAASYAGPLAEEARAREVEAWRSVGDTEAMKRAAERYLEKYPGGEYADRVKKLIGLTIE